MKLTMAGVADSIKQQHGTSIPVWKLRRVIDSLAGSGGIVVERMAQYRVLSAEDVPAVISELQRTGWLPEAATCNC